MAIKFKAVVIDNQNEKFTREIKELDSSHLRDGNVLIKIDYSSLNYKDAMILKDGGKIVRKFPFVPGIDFSGKVIESEDERFKKDENIIEFEIFASSFCHQMVRSIVGTIVRVGKGHISEKKIPEILTAHDRQGAGSPAPPNGLILWSVQYPDFNDDLERVAETESAP